MIFCFLGKEFIASISRKLLCRRHRGS